jgi:hypothetical protein
MKQLAANLSHIATNMHVSVPVILGALFAVAPIWLPQYADKLNTTAVILMSYGIIAASNTPADKLTPKQ